MKKRRTKTVVNATKELMQKGKKTLRGKAGAAARKLKKTVGGGASTASRRLKKGVKKIRSTAASRQAGKLGRAVGGFLGQAIGSAQKLVTQVVKK